MCVGEGVHFNTRYILGTCPSNLSIVLGKKYVSGDVKDDVNK